MTKRRAMQAIRKIPHVYPTRVLLRHYRREIAFLLLVVAAVFVEPARQEGGPYANPTSHDLDAIADTSIYDSVPWRSPFWPNAAPQEEWFPEGQKKAPCEKGIETEW